MTYSEFEDRLMLLLTEFMGPTPIKLGCPVRLQFPLEQDAGTGIGVQLSVGFIDDLGDFTDGK